MLGLGAVVILCGMDSSEISQLKRICQLHILNANLLFYHIPVILYWIQIWWLRRPLKHMFMETVWDFFVTWHIMELAIRRWVNCGYKGMLVVNNTLTVCGIQMILDWGQENLFPHHNTTTTSLYYWNKTVWGPWIHAVMLILNVRSPW